MLEDNYYGMDGLIWDENSLNGVWLALSPSDLFPIFAPIWSLVKLPVPFPNCWRRINLLLLSSQIHKGELFCCMNIYSAILLLVPTSEALWTQVSGLWALYWKWYKFQDSWVFWNVFFFNRHNLLYVLTYCNWLRFQYVTDCSQEHMPIAIWN